MQTTVRRLSVVSATSTPRRRLIRVAQPRTSPVSSNETSPEVVDTRWLEPGKSRKAAILMSVAIYGAMLFAMLQPDSMEYTLKMFSATSGPFGTPLWLIVALSVTVVFLPLPFAFYHLFQIMFRGASEGRRLSGFGIVHSVFAVPSRHPDLRRSRFIVLLILGGYIAAMFIYAFLADEAAIRQP